MERRSPEGQNRNSTRDPSPAESSRLRPEASSRISEFIIRTSIAYHGIRAKIAEVRARRASSKLIDKEGDAEFYGNHAGAATLRLTHDHRDQSDYKLIDPQKNHTETTHYTNPLIDRIMLNQTYKTDVHLPVVRPKNWRQRQAEKRMENKIRKSENKEEDLRWRRGVEGFRGSVNRKETRRIRKDLSSEAKKLYKTGQISRTEYEIKLSQSKDHLAYGDGIDVSRALKRTDKNAVKAIAKPIKNVIKAEDRIESLQKSAANAETSLDLHRQRLDELRAKNHRNSKRHN